MSKPFGPAEMEANALVSKVWHDFRTHERALARLGIYRDDIAKAVTKEHPHKYLNKLKSHVLAQLRDLDKQRVSHTELSVSKDELKAAVEWVSTLTLDEVDELAEDYVDEDQTPKRPYLMYAGLVFLGAALEYLFSHWVH